MNKLSKGICVVGSTTVDKIVALDQSHLKLGGVTTYAGITYRRHGIPTLIVSNLADSDVNLIDKFKTEKIEFYKGDSERTTHFINSGHLTSGKKN